MALTKKQKHYLRQNWGKQPLSVISRHFQVPEAEVEAAVKALNLGVEPSKAGKQSGGKRPVWQESYFFPMVLLVFAAIVGIICFDSKLYISGDNVEFMDLGTGIREGNGLLSTTKYTPLFPLLLAFIQIVSDNSLIAQKILVLLFYIGSAPFLFLIFRRYIGNIWAAAAAAIVVMNAFIIEFGHVVMSEMPYLFFSVLAIALFNKYTDRQKNRMDYGYALAAIAATYYVRPAALALFAAVIVYFLLRKQWKLVLISGVIFFIAVLPWNIRNQLLAGGSDYSKALFLKNPYNPDLGVLTIPEFFGRVWYNTKLYATQEIPYVLFPFRFRTTMAHTAPFPAYFGVALTIAALAGYIRYLLRYRSLTGLYIFFYTGIILMWSEQWSGARFIVPIMPFLIFFFVYFIYDIIEKARQTQFAFGVKIAGIAAIGLIALLNVKNVYAWNSHMGRYSPEWENYFKAAEWVRDNTPEDAVFADRKAGLFKIIARRKGTGTPGSYTPWQHMQFFYERNVDYLIIPSIGYSDIGRYIVPTVNTFGEWFTVAYFLDNPPTYVLKLDRSKAMPDSIPPAADQQ